MKHNQNFTKNFSLFCSIFVLAHYSETLDICSGGCSNDWLDTFVWKRTQYVDSTLSQLDPPGAQHEEDQGGRHQNC
jgi:hypothetical protein